jgi:hypothetical protein
LLSGADRRMMSYVGRYILTRLWAAAVADRDAIDEWEGRMLSRLEGAVRRMFGANRADT